VAGYKAWLGSRSENHSSKLNHHNNTTHPSDLRFFPSEVNTTHIDHQSNDDSNNKKKMLKKIFIAIAGVLTLKHIRQKRRARRGVAY
jgi:hypothetical protein